MFQQAACKRGLLFFARVPTGRAFVVSIAANRFHTEDTMVAERMLPQGMFADSMLESSWSQRSRRSWSTVISFGLEAIGLGLLVLVPLLTAVHLPSARTVSTPISVGRPDPGPAPMPHAERRGAVQIVPVTPQLQITAPPRIPPTIVNGDDSAAPPPVGDGIGVGDPHGLPTGLPNVLTNSIRGAMPVAAPKPAPTVERVVRTSQMMEGSLIRRIQPVYPVPARNMRVQGPVVLAALISKSGTIENLRVLSGHPLLVPAAIDAVSQWRYRPYILNSEPIEVETQITVNFILGN
jgi:protein TonB